VPHLRGTGARGEGRSARSVARSACNGWRRGGLDPHRRDCGLAVVDRCGRLGRRSHLVCHRPGAMASAAGKPDRAAHGPGRFAWFASLLDNSRFSPLYTGGLFLSVLFLAVFGHVLLAFPSGRLEGRLPRAVVAAAYLDTTAVVAVSVVFRQPACGCVQNLALIDPNTALSEAFRDVARGVEVLAILVGLAVLAHRWRRATPPWRRAVAPVLWWGAAGMAVAVFTILTQSLGSHGRRGSCATRSRARSTTRRWPSPTGSLSSVATSMPMAAPGAPLGGRFPRGNDRGAWGPPRCRPRADASLREDPALVEAVCAAAGLALELLDHRRRGPAVTANPVRRPAVLPHCLRVEPVAELAGDHPVVSSPVDRGADERFGQMVPITLGGRGGSRQGPMLVPATDPPRAG
jgi:hypothetical protein